MGDDENRSKRRREFLRDDLVAYWSVYAAAAFFMIAFLYVVFVRHGSTSLAATTGGLALGCVLWPRSAGLRARVFGQTGVEAPKEKGSELEAPELQVPDVNAPLKPDDDAAQQPDDPR